MKASIRRQVYEKYNGKCAYTGKDLPSDWQVDHMESIRNNEYSVFANRTKFANIKDELNKVNDISNLMPALRIVNHYKRSFGLEGFRASMMDFHKRLSKLPRNPYAPNSIRRKEYMYKVADAFDITPDKPFSGKFYFELNQREEQK